MAGLFAESGHLFFGKMRDMNTPSTYDVSSDTALLDPVAAQTEIDRAWDDDLVGQLSDYIEIPAKSPAFDGDWAAHGHIETVLRRAAAWVEAQRIEGLKLEVIRLEGRTPVLFFEVPKRGTAGDSTVLMYGHLDKQPEFNGWRSDLGPWTPKYEGGKLYGRGGADDGYAVYAAITAIDELQRQNVAHPRIVGLIETCEESGSYDLLPYVDALRAPGADRLGDVALVVCLDSGAGNYDQLWLTTSLRGMASGTLKVEVLTEGVHSGDASGLVPSSFRIMRQVLDRLEDSAIGPPAARELSLRSAARAACAGQAHRSDPWRRDLQAVPVGQLRLWRLHSRRCCRPRPIRCRRC